MVIYSRIQEAHMRILVTGGCGFIGSHFIRHMLNKYQEYEILNIDALTYAGNLSNTHDFMGNERYCFNAGNISDNVFIDSIMPCVDVVVNFAAESHVCRSILNPDIFVKSNILGTQVLLEAAKKYNIKRFIQVSTDEVYGSINKGYFTEQSNIAPNSPYSASKASADLLCRSYHETYKMPILITRCSNNYGTHQYPEKIIPLFINKLLNIEYLTIHGDGQNVRDWLHVTDHCKAIDVVLHKGNDGEIYNVGANTEKTNLEIANIILKEMNMPSYMIKHVDDRLGNDRRYAIDSTKLKQLGWKPEVDFEEGIKETIKWYMDNKEFFECVQS